AKTIAQPRPLAEAHLSLSIAYRFFCEYELAEEQGQLALHQTVILGDEQMRGKMLTTLGFVARVRGELEPAVTRLRQALILSRQYDPPTLVARKLNNLATTLHLNEQIEAALRCCDEAAALLLNTASQLDKIRVANTRGACHFDLQAYPQAEKAFRHALVLLQRHPELLRSRALTLMNLGNALLKQSQLTEAATRLQQALPLWQQVNDEIHYANSLDTLGKVLLAQGEQATADRLFKQAVAIFDKFPDSVWVQRFRKN
ncbi:MAG: tetratricopeptide repeat protein, partial [Methylococcales bacterium]|nr:tetratricopeptide repeat protein [Methylococcales bacterium]